MSAEGCIITSVAMIFKSFGDNVTPKTMLEKLKKSKADCPFNWLSAAKEYKHTYKDKTFGSFDKLKNSIFNLIVNSKIPIMVRVPGHTVVARGFNGTLPVDAKGNPDLSKITSNMILVNDPGSSKNKTLADVINQKGAVEYINYYTK